MQELIKRKLLKVLKPDGFQGFEVPLEALDDAAVVNGVVFTTDRLHCKTSVLPGG